MMSSTGSTPWRDLLPDLATPQPQVKKNLLMIRGVLAVALAAFVFLRFQAPDPPKLWLGIYLALLALSFLPLALAKEERWEAVYSQYGIFAMDLALILGVLFLTDRLETEFLLSFFLTLFISALSRSVTNSLLVGIAVTGLYAYRVYWVSTAFNPYDPFLILSCSLLILVALHSGYLASRAVEEENALVDLARRMKSLNEEVKEGSQAAMEYAATLKNVLDTLPLGALAVSREGLVVFINQTAAKLLEMNPRALLNVSISNPKMGLLGEAMIKSVKDKVLLKKEYVDLDWNGHPKRFRLDSSVGTATNGSPWGTLFLIQEATRPAAPADPTQN